MKKELCPRCLKIRFNNSPARYTWWTVRGEGRMCWKCYKDWERNKARKGKENQ